MPYLTLAEVLDEADLVDAPDYAAPFGGLPAVLSLSTKAWLFSTSVAKT